MLGSQPEALLERGPNDFDAAGITSSRTPFVIGEPTVKHMKLGTHRGHIIGAMLLTSLVGGCLSGTATDTGSGPFFTITLDSGIDNQSVAAGTALGLRVRVTHEGTPQSGALILWTVTAGGGQAVNQQNVTDSLGHATATWILGNAVGANTLSISTVDDSLTVHAQGVPGHATTLDRVSADTSNVAAGSPVTLSVKALDALGNPVPGATVQWTATAAGLQSQQSTTDATGTASVVFQPSAAGNYVVNAILPGEASLVFFVNAS